MEGIANIHNQCFLLRHEVELCLDISVDTLTSLTSNGDDGSIGLLYLFINSNRRDANLRIFLLSKVFHLEPFARMTLSLELHFGIFDIFTIDIRHRFCRSNTCILQAFQHVDNIRGMNATRTRTTREELIAVLAKQGYRLDGTRLPRQCAIILQQYNTLCGTLTSDGCMGLKIRLIGIRILMETGRLDDILQHVAHITVHIGHAELTALHTLDDLLHLCWLSWLHQVVACMHLRDGWQAFANTNPVGHHNTLIAPIFTQNLGQQVVITHRELTVHLIITSHNGPRIALTDSYLKTSQIKLASCSLTDSLVNSSTVCLLRIDCKVLGTDTSPLTLHTFNISSSYLSCHQWVFAVILEVTATQRIAMQVHTWTQYHIATIFLGLIANSLAYFAYQLCIPS